MVHTVLSALFAEPRVGKAQAKRLKGDSRSLRNCRHIYSAWHHNTASLLADTADIAAARAFVMKLIQADRTE